MSPTQFRLAAHHNGYLPVPVRSGEKRPMFPDWPIVAASAGPAEIERWETLLPDHGSTGILCGRVVGPDLDIHDAKLADQIEALAMDILGMSPLRRVGSKGCILVYRAAVGSIASMSTPRFIMPDGRPAQVEIIGSDRQFVAFGIHPSGKPYEWLPGADPATVPLPDLPPVTVEQLREFMNAATEKLRAAGGAAIERAAAQTRLATSVKDAASLAPRNTAALLELIESLPNPPEADRDVWRDVNLAVRGCIEGLRATRRLGDGDEESIEHAAAEWGALHHTSEGYEAERAKADDDWSKRDRNLAGWRNLQIHAKRLGVNVDKYRLADAEQEFTALPDEAPGEADVPPPPMLHRGDPVRSAREMISRHHTRDGECVLHHQGGQFYRWTGTHYLETTPEDVRAEAYRFLEGAFHVEADKEPVPFTPNKSRVDTAMDALRAEVHLNSAIRAPAWLGNATTDRPPARELLACRNGLLHLPTRRLLEHSPQFFAVNALGYDYEGDAPAPARWLDFLRTVWPHDPESVGTLQEIFGLLLTGETRHQKIFLVVGPKRSGKGTIGRILTTMLGRENVCNPTLAALSQNFGLAPLIGKPLALISDARLSGRADVHVVAERLLSISGEDGQTIDRKHMPAWTGTLPTRFMVLSNELPRLTDASGALAGRFIILQMRQSFYGCEDLGLTEKLLPELPGIFNWALTGLDRLTARGHFVQPASAREAIADLEELASPVGAFIKERCTTGPGHTVSRNDLFAAWVAWCRDEGREHPGTAAGFGRDLRAAIPTLGDRFTRAGGALHRQYTGIGLLPHATAVSQGLF